MKNQLANNQQDRIDLNKTIHRPVAGRNLLEAVCVLLWNQATYFDGVTRLEVLSARRISTSYRVQITGHEGERREIWEFEIFTHAD